MKHHITITRNGAAIYVDLLGPRAGVAVSRQPHLLTLVAEFLQSAKTSGQYLVLEHDFERHVGNNDVVKTGPHDRVVYAKRLRQTGYDRFVRNKSSKSSSYISVVLRRDTEGSYELEDIWIGRLRPALPDTEEATDQSKTYWETHAFMLEGQAIQTRSMTTVRPY